MAIYLSRDNQRLGPFDDEQVLAGMRGGTYSPDLLAWREGMAAWQPLRALFPAENLPPPPLPPGMGVPRPQNLGGDAGMRMILPVGRSGWAIAAGYLGLFAVLLLPAPLALIISLVAIWDIRRSRSLPEPKHGMGRAVFGLIMGGLFTVALIALLLGRR